MPGILALTGKKERGRGIHTNKRGEDKLLRNIPRSPSKVKPPQIGARRLSKVLSPEMGGKLKGSRGRETGGGKK